MVRRRRVPVDGGRIYLRYRAREAVLCKEAEVCLWFVARWTGSVDQAPTACSLANRGRNAQLILLGVVGQARCAALGRRSKVTTGEFDTVEQIQIRLEASNEGIQI